MSQEKLLAEELNRMINEDMVPLSVAEDVHEICRSLLSGEISINDLHGKDDFIEHSIQEAMNRINHQ